MHAVPQRGIPGFEQTPESAPKHQLAIAHPGNSKAFPLAVCRRGHAEARWVARSRPAQGPVYDAASHCPDHGSRPVSSALSRAMEMRTSTPATRNARKREDGAAGRTEQRGKGGAARNGGNTKNTRFSTKPLAAPHHQEPAPPAPAPTKIAAACRTRQSYTSI